MLYALDELHVESLGHEKKLPEWHAAAMHDTMGARAANLARALIDARSQALRPYVMASGKTIASFAGVSYFDSDSRLTGDDRDHQTALLPAMLDVGVVPPELCRAMVRNAEAEVLLRREVRRLRSFDDATLASIHERVKGCVGARVG
jgi:hypothetical protein